MCDLANIKDDGTLPNKLKGLSDDDTDNLSEVLEKMV